MSLPSEFVLVPRPSSSCSIFWRRDRFEDEDEGRGRPREHLAEERFMESLHPFSRTHWDHEPELRKPLAINETTFRFMESSTLCLARIWF